jgi:glucose-6-phosphate isomerase
MRFIANVDPTDFAMETRNLDWESTLVIISSKSFTTMETALNMNLVKQQMSAALQKLNPSLTSEAIFAKHFLASTANFQNALKAGIPDESCFKFWDWVGGRFSVTYFLTLGV